MKNFKFGSKARNIKDSPRRSFGGRDSRKPLLYDAVCDECGKNCKVPFKPSGDKPVYCSDCFEKKGGRDGNRSGRRNSQRHNFSDKDRSILQLVEKIGILNTKLDAIISLLSSKAGQKKSNSAKGETEKNIKSKPKKRAKTKVGS